MHPRIGFHFDNFGADIGVTGYNHYEVGIKFIDSEIIRILPSFTIWAGVPEIIFFTASGGESITTHGVDMSAGIGRNHDRLRLDAGIAITANSGNDYHPTGYFKTQVHLNETYSLGGGFRVGKYIADFHLNASKHW